MIRQVQWTVPGRLAVVAFAVAGLSACSLFPDRSLVYQDLEERESLVLPDTYAGNPPRDLYVVPAVNAPRPERQDRFRLPRPPDLTGEILTDDYLVETVDDQTWLLVNDVPGRVWPAVSAFLSSQGAGVAYDSPSLGLMQTPVLNLSQRTRQWLELEDDEARYQVLQARVRHGVRRRSTEVQVRLLGTDERPAAVLEWRDEAQDPDRETTVLQQMAAFLEAGQEDKAYSRQALNLPRPEQVRRVVDEDGLTRAIEMDLARNRAWAEVNRALSNAEIPVLDFDRSEGLWFVDRHDYQERRRWWRFWRRSVEAEPRYLAELREADGGFVLTAAPSPDHAGDDLSRVILERIYDYLR